MMRDAYRQPPALEQGVGRSGYPFHQDRGNGGGLVTAASAAAAPARSHNGRDGDYGDNGYNRHGHNGYDGHNGHNGYDGGRVQQQQQLGVRVQQSNRPTTNAMAIAAPASSHNNNSSNNNSGMPSNPMEMLLTTVFSPLNIAGA